MLQCFPLLKEACQRASLQFTKEHRVSMRSIHTLLKQMPNLKIIHYVRHPGAIAVSRDKTNNTWPDGNRDLVTEAKMICSQMMQDIRTRKVLERTYPDAFLSMKYEDLVSSPGPFIRKVFNHIGHPLPKDLIHNIESSLHADIDKKSDTYVWGTKRKNATETADAWRKHVSAAVMRGMAIHCKALYNELGYS